MKPHESVKGRLVSQISNSQLTMEEYMNIFGAASDGIVIYDIGLESVIEANPAACRMHGYTREEFMALDPSVLMRPENYALFKEQSQAVAAGDVLEASIVHVHKDGTEFHVEVRRSTMLFRGRACLLSLIRDVSQRVRTEKNLSKRIDSQMREQATLLAISHTLASTLEFQPGLILDQLHEIIAYTRCALFTLEDSTLVSLAMRGTPQFERSLPFRIPLREAKTLDRLFNGHKPVRVADVWSEDDPQAGLLRSLLSDGASALLEGTNSWIWIPLAVKGRVLGGIGVAHKTRGYFTLHHADLALSVANQAAITLINVELNEQAQALAVLEERQRLAHNLHDAINQSLFSVGLIAEVLPRLWERDQTEARRSLEDLRRLTRGAMAEMRALLAELRPSTIADAELGDLLRLLANAFTGRTNIPAKISVVGQGILPTDVQLAIYRICQEALNNITKHAHASLVALHLKHESSGIELSIRDNGRGFDPDRTVPGHYGLSIMREHAQGVNARLAIQCRPGRGTEVIIRWSPPGPTAEPGPEDR